MLSDQHPGSINQALSRINLLAEKQQVNQDSENPKDIDQLFMLIGKCIHLGTIPFSILARHGFIAKTLLLSLIERNILSIDEAHLLLASIRTIASDLVDDMKRYQANKITHNEFMMQYGHLRPGTYDIMSSRYDQMSDFGGIDNETVQKQVVSEYQLTSSQKKSINNFLSFKL